MDQARRRFVEFFYTVVRRFLPLHVIEADASRPLLLVDYANFLNVIHVIEEILGSTSLELILIMLISL